MRRNTFWTEELWVEGENFFLLLRVQLAASTYHISQIRSVGLNYQIEFHEGTKLETIKEFLKRDTKLLFQVVDIQRLRTPRKGFANEQKFLEYLERVFAGCVQNKKIIRRALKHG
jgi:hypothetical protein